jgi:hypothetical protein
LTLILQPEAPSLDTTDKPQIPGHVDFGEEVFIDVLVRSRHETL